MFPFEESFLSYTSIDRYKNRMVSVLVWWECSVAYMRKAYIIWIFPFRGEGNEPFNNVGSSFPSPPHLIQRADSKALPSWNTFSLHLFTGSLISTSSPWSQSSCPCAGFLHLPLQDCFQSLLLSSQSSWLNSLSRTSVSSSPGHPWRVKGTWPTLMMSAQAW